MLAQLAPNESDVNSSSLNIAFLIQLLVIDIYNIFRDVDRLRKALPQRLLRLAKVSLEISTIYYHIYVIFIYVCVTVIILFRVERVKLLVIVVSSLEYYINYY